jgi:hypothetical protein
MSTATLQEQLRSVLIAAFWFPHAWPMFLEAAHFKVQGFWHDDMNSELGSTPFGG